MAPRAALPGELFLDAIAVYPTRSLVGADQRGVAVHQWVRTGKYDKATLERAKRRSPYIALRWVLNPALGIPLEPFTVWRRPVAKREAPGPLPWHQTAFDTWSWDGVTEMLLIELDLTGPVTAQGLTRADLDPVATVSGSAGQTIVLDAGPMLGVRLDHPGSVSAVRGLSTNVMANGGGWTPFERVGLPFGGGFAGVTYYDGAQQGPTGALTDATSAAINRLEAWGPVVGWPPLAGLAPWQPPDPAKLVAEMQGDLIQDLAQIMAAHGPPLVGEQLKAEVTHKLPELRQVVGARVRHFGGGPHDRSDLIVRPLQALTTAVATDTWSSLALGFGTGDSVGRRQPSDYMVTAPWHGLMTVALPDISPGPWFSSLFPPQFITEEVERELVAIVLDPSVRSAPSAPAPVDVQLGFDEGAPDVDERYEVGVVLRAPRLKPLPRQPRASGYALARFDSATSGRYELRRHPAAGGWIPIGAAEPVPNLGDPPDPAVVPGTVMLRDHGVRRPLSGPAAAYEYAVAASDLFGQWSGWTPAWFALPPAGVQAPVLSGVRARAVPGPGDADPCSLTVALELVWNIRERSCSQLHLAIDVYPPTPPPPDPYDDPPDLPQGGAVTVADVYLPISPDGDPGPAPAGVTVTAVHDDDTPVSPIDPPDPGERRYRIVLSGLAVTYAGAPELAVAAYAQAEETIRLGEWSGWAHTREVAIAPNPLPPPTPAPLAVVYPDWASLPDAAGLSYAPVTWTPTGAWRYRVYEATEAALLGACGRPGPVLTQGYGGRMQALFDLYKDPANLEKLKSAYRKLGTEPVLPPVENGRMRHEALLPRGSSLIHCFVVAGVSESNVVSSWPQPDADGRKAFHAYAIPRPLQPAQPEIHARLDANGHPVVTVDVGGAVPATGIVLYRAANAILARQTGTMEKLPPIATNPASWQRTTYTDATATPGWQRLQYRAVALTVDDPERAQMAVPSEPSRSHALLDPPPAPPPLALTPNVAGSTATLSLVRVDTDALRRGSDIGDFLLATVVSASGTDPARFSSSLSAIPTFASLGVFAGSAETAGYVGTGSAYTLYLRVPHPAGETVGLAVDVADPLSRTTHVSVDIPPYVPDPAPVVSLSAVRSGGIVRVVIDTNVPDPPSPAREWYLRISTRRTTPFAPPPSSMTFAVSTIATIATAAQMPNPALVPDNYAIRRIDGTGEILMWGRSPYPLRVGVTLTNSESVSASAVQVTS